jgi:hypothetical protein
MIEAGGRVAAFVLTTVLAIRLQSLTASAIARIGRSMVSIKMAAAGTARLFDGFD